MEATQSTTGGSPKIAEDIQPALDGLISAMAEHVASRAVYQLSGPSADAALAKLQQAYVALNDACDKAHLQLEAERLRVIREQSMAADAKFAGAAGGELKQMQDIQSQTAALFAELQKSAPPEAPPPKAPAASIERSRTAALPRSSLPGSELRGQTALEAAAASDVIMVTAAPEGTPPAAAAQPQGAPLQGATPGGSSDMIMAVADAPGPGGALLLQPPAALAAAMDAAATAPAAPEAPQASAAPAGAMSGTPATPQGSMPPPPAPSVSAFAAIQQHEPGSLAPSADGALTQLLTATSVPGQTAPAAPGAAAADGTAAPDEFMLGRMESLPQLPGMDMEGFFDL